MRHEISGIEYDFQGGADEFVKFVLKGVTVEDLIRGVSLSCGRVTFLDEEGCICQMKSVEMMFSDELIDMRNGLTDTGFMDELPSLDIDEEKIKQIREGASAEKVLTKEEVNEIMNFFECDICLSFYYADTEVLFDPNDEDT